VTPIWSSHVDGLRSTYSATQPPRYTIFWGDGEGDWMTGVGAQSSAPRCDERPVPATPDRSSDGALGSKPEF